MTNSTVAQQWHGRIEDGPLLRGSGRFGDDVKPQGALFAQFVRSPSATLAHARLAVAGREPRHIGHNPLGGWMIVALLVATALAAGSGWLYVTDAYWGDEHVENLHQALAIALLALAALHVLGVVAASLRHRENLVASMFHGRKRAPADDDVA